MDYAGSTRKLRLFAESDLQVDKTLVLVLLAMTGIGLVMVASASIPIAEQKTHQPFYFLIRQFAYLLVGMLGGYFILKVESNRWRRWAPVLLLFALVSLILVLMPGIGKVVNGSRRWISLGIVNLQVSELVKFCVLVYVADYLVRHKLAVQAGWMGFLRLMMIVLLISGLILAEPDFGTAVVLLSSCMAVMYLAGVGFFRLLPVVAVVAAVFALLASSTEYQLERLLSFWNPWADPYGAGYQLTNALIALGSGGIDGVGLGSSVQKLFYLPEAHTDFVYAVLGEELGLIGTVSVLLLFALFVWRAFVIAANAIGRQMYFCAYMAYGIGSWIGIQAVINIGVNLGVLPTKGITLPLMSYGGSSLVVTVFALALLLRIDYDTRQTEEVQYKRKYQL